MPTKSKPFKANQKAGSLLPASAKSFVSPFPPRAIRRWWWLLRVPWGALQGCGPLHLSPKEAESGPVDSPQDATLGWMMPGEVPCGLAGCSLG